MLYVYGVSDPNVNIYCAGRISLLRHVNGVNHTIFWKAHLGMHGECLNEFEILGICSWIYEIYFSGEIVFESALQ